MIGGRDLYLIQSRVTGTFKVGRSSNVENRLEQLQVGSPYELRIILVVQNMGWREKRIHAILSRFHSQGQLKGEWFIEPGMASLPDDLYELLDLEVVNTWWESAAGPIHIPSPVGPSRRARHTPLCDVED